MMRRDDRCPASIFALSACTWPLTRASPLVAVRELGVEPGARLVATIKATDIRVYR